MSGPNPVSPEILRIADEIACEALGLEADLIEARLVKRWMAANEN
jgi:hypothetical protein